MRDLGSPPSFRKVWNSIKELSKRIDEMRIIQTPNIRVGRTAMGQRIEVMPTSKTTASVGMVFRGEWSADNVDYSEQDVVVIPAGADAGTYVCTKPHTSGTTIAPIVLGQSGHGEYWYQLQLNQKSSVVWS